MLNREELSKERLAICEKCPLYKVDKLHGPMCDSNKYISPDGAQWSWFKKSGWKRGCGCHLSNKTKNPMNHCIIERW